MKVHKLLLKVKSVGVGIGIVILDLYLLVPASDTPILGHFLTELTFYLLDVFMSCVFSLLLQHQVFQARLCLGAPARLQHGPE